MCSVALTQHLGHHVAGERRDGRLVDDDEGTVHVIGDRVGRRFDIRQIGLTTLPFGRAHGDDGVVRTGYRVLVRRRELKAPGFRIALHKLIHARFVKGHLVTLELSYLLAVDVDDHDVVAQVGQARGRGQADIAGANYSDSGQSGPIISVRAAALFQE